MKRPVDMDGRPYALGQIVLVATGVGASHHIERREVLKFSEKGLPMVGPPGGVTNGKARGTLMYPERHYIERAPDAS